MKDLKVKRDLSTVRETLLARQKRLELDIVDLQNGKYDSDMTAQDPADQASSAVFENIQNSLQNNELEEYKMIVKALDMIDKGIYGSCIDCEESISERRLQSYPNASRCVMCQERAEEGLTRLTDF